MTAYIVAHVDIRDWDRYREYMRHTPGVIARHGGRFVARGGETVLLEGEPDNLRLVVIEFPDLAHAVAFYRSPEYAEVKRLREGAGSARFVAIEGYPESEWLRALEASPTRP
jgi:uncharacterized protein (DUF1330 family)